MSLPADKQKKLIDDAENAAVQDSSVSSTLVLPLVDLARHLMRKARLLEPERDRLRDACVRIVRDAQLSNLDGDKARRLAENVQALLVPLVGDGT